MSNRNNAEQNSRPEPDIKYKDESTQTEGMIEESHSFDYSKLYLLLLEIFSGNILRESLPVRKCLLKSAMRHTFWKELEANSVDKNLNVEECDDDGVLSHSSFENSQMNMYAQAG